MKAKANAENRGKLSAVYYKLKPQKSGCYANVLCMGLFIDVCVIMCCARDLKSLSLRSGLLGCMVQGQAEWGTVCEFPEMFQPET